MEKDHLTYLCMIEDLLDDAEDKLESEEELQQLVIALIKHLADILQ